MKTNPVQIKYCLFLVFGIFAMPVFGDIAVEQLLFGSRNPLMVGGPFACFAVPLPTLIPMAILIVRKIRGEKFYLGQAEWFMLIALSFSMILFGGVWFRSVLV